MAEESKDPVGLLLSSLGIEPDARLVNEPQRLGMVRARERTAEEEQAFRERQARRDQEETKRAARDTERRRRQNRTQSWR